MPAYIVLAASLCGATLEGHANAQVVFAANATQAKEICASKFDSDGALWSTATVTEVTACTNWSGWTFKIEITKGFGTGGADPNSVTVLGSDTNETIDKVAALLVTALNALPVIANASYDAATNILTVASIADGIGDAKLLVTITPPDGKSAIASLVGTVVDGGIAGAVLTVILPADSAVIPRTVLQGAV